MVAEAGICTKQPLLGYEPSETLLLHSAYGAAYPNRTGIFTKGWCSRPVGDHSPLRGMVDSRSYALRSLVLQTSAFTRLA